MYNFFRKSTSWDNTELPAFWKYAFLLLSYALTVYLTIIITPNLNATFEEEKRKTAFFVENIKLFSEDTKDLLGDVTELLDKIKANEDVHDVRLSSRSTLTKLHWRRVEFSIIFSDSKPKELLTSYGTTINHLSSEIGKTPPNPESIAKASHEFGLLSARIVELLASEAGL